MQEQKEILTTVLQNADILQTRQSFLSMNKRALSIDFGQLMKPSDIIADVQSSSNNNKVQPYEVVAVLDYEY